MEFIVKNKDQEPRKFYDNKLGRYVILAPKEEAITMYPPKQEDIFSVKEKGEKTKTKNKKIHKEVI